MLPRNMKPIDWLAFILLSLIGAISLFCGIALKQYLILIAGLCLFTALGYIYIEISDREKIKKGN